MFQSSVWLNDDLIARAAKLSAASLHEAAGKIGALPATIRPLAPHIRLCGRAFPVRIPPGDNLLLHHAVYAAAPGDVLVVDAGGGAGFGHWGDILAAAAQKRQIAGLVISGGVRDGLQLIEMAFPVFATGLAIQGTGKDPHGSGSIGAPIVLGNARVAHGDLLFGDADGLVVLPAVNAEAIVERAIARDRDEDLIRERIEAGETTLAIYGLPSMGEARAAKPRRRSVNVEGLDHRGLPIPVASRIGSLIATGGIRGVDRASGEMPADIEAQSRLMFENLQTIVESSGGTVADILKVTIWLAAPEGRAAIGGPWLKMFPDEESRPARHVLIYALPGNMLVQCEALAVVTK